MINECDRLIEAIRSVGWRAALEQVEEREPFDFCTAMIQKVSEAEAAGDIQAAGVFRFLARTFHGDLLTIDPIPKNRPSKPEEDGHLSLLWTLTDTELDAMAILLQTEMDLELRARFGDWLWLRRKDYKAAVDAIEAYLDVADSLPTDPWIYPEHRYRRAMQLAGALGKKAPIFQEAADRVERALARLGGKDERFLTLRLIGLLDQYGVGDIGVHAKLAEKRGAAALGTSHQLNSDYLVCAAKLYERLGRDDDAKRCWACAAEEMRMHAETFMQAPGNRMAGANWLGVAIKLLSNARGSEDRRDELHLTMLEWQQVAMADMIPIRNKFELPQEFVEEIRAIPGSFLAEGLVRLATFTAIGPPSLKHLRESVEAETKSPLFRIMPKAWIRSDGKVDEVLTGIGIDGSVPEEVMRSLMHDSARLRWQVGGQLINLCIDQMHERHGEGPFDLDWLVSSSSFVPPEHREIFKRGLEAGLQRDLHVAMLFLVPQVENSFRYMLNQRRVVASGLDSDRTQDEHLLNRLLAHPRLMELLGEDTIFDLRGLLTERAGANLRNEIAHGMTSDRRLLQYDCLYVWWLLLRLTVLHWTPPTSGEPTAS